jgi:hypothetical protein
MGKVVTSAGVEEFVREGKFTQVANHKPGKSNGDAPPLETVKAAPTIDVKPAEGAKPDAKVEPAKPTPKAEVKADTDEDLADLTAEERETAKTERVRKIIGKKHSQLKAAEALAAQREADAEEAERFAETQFHENSLLKKQLAELEGRQPKQAVTPPVEKKAPTAADFTNAQGQVDWDAYTDAKAAFAADKAVAAERERQAKEKADADTAVRVAQLKAQTETARAKYPDFDRTLRAVQGTAADQVPQFVLNYLYESDLSAEVAYHLAKHPEEAQRIGKLKPIRGVAELGKLEDQLTKSQTPITAATPVRSERGGAPAPITPLEDDGAGGRINLDPSTMSYKELRAYHRERERERRKH